MVVCFALGKVEVLVFASVGWFISSKGKKRKALQKKAILLAALRSKAGDRQPSEFNYGTDFGRNDATMLWEGVPQT